MSQTVAPWVREAGPAVVAAQAGVVPGDARGVRLVGPRALAHDPDHPGADGVVRVLVDEDERARGAVLAVGVGDDRRARAQGDPRDVVELELVGRGLLPQRGHVEQDVDRLDRGTHGARRVLERDVLAGAQRALRHPADRRLEVAAGDRQVVGADDHLAAADVEVVRELDGDRVGRRGGRQRPVVGLDREHRGAAAAGQDRHRVTGAQRAARDLAGVAALAPRGLLGADDPLDRQPERALAAVAGDVDLLQVGQQRRAVVPVRAAALDDVVAVQRGDREHLRLVDAELRGRARRTAPRSRGSAPRPSRRGPSC